MIDGTTGKRFSSSYQPVNRGRKRSALKEFLRDNQISLQDIRLLFKNIIVMKMSEIQKLREQALELPAIIGFIVSALLKDYEAGKLDTFNNLLDRIYGKPMQQVELGQVSGSIPDTPEERQALAEKIEKELAELYGIEFKNTDLVA